ncbi:MAG: DUF1934 family protein [Eubacteriales bacterium]
MHYNVIVAAEIRQYVANANMLDAPSEIKKLLADAFTSEFKIVSEGTLSSKRDGRITLRYKSTNGCETVISFSKKEPGLIALTRGDNSLGQSVTVFLEEGTRRRCIGKGPQGEHMEYTVRALRVDNRLLKSGKLVLEYAIDVCGVCAENTRMTVSVTHDKSENICPKDLKNGDK